MKSLLVVLVLLPAAAFAQTTNAITTSAAPSGTVTEMNPIVVDGSLDTAREQIAPDLGASQYTISSQQIATQSQGDNASFNQTLLRLSLIHI